MKLTLDVHFNIIITAQMQLQLIKLQLAFYKDTKFLGSVWFIFLALVI